MNRFEKGGESSGSVGNEPKEVSESSVDPNGNEAEGDRQYRIGPPSRDNEDEILELLRETVGETVASKKTADFWRWKHSLSPFGPSYSVCAFETEHGKVAGLRTLMWWSFRDRNGDLHRAARAVDTATHPSHQRRGIFTRLTHFAIDDLREKGADFIFNTPNDQSLPGYLKMGWKEVARWPVYMRPRRWFEIVQKVLKGSGPHRLHSGESMVQEHGLTGWKNFRANYSPDFEELVSRNEKLRTRVGYRTKRDLDFLDWRYGEHPDVEYGVHTVTDDTGLIGVIIGRPVSGVAGLTALVITELLLRDPSPRQGKRLLSSLIEHVTCDYVMAHFAEGTMERRALGLARFIRAPRRGYTFAVRPLRELPNDPTQRTAWDLTLGELEIF